MLRVPRAFRVYKDPLEQLASLVRPVCRVPRVWPELLAFKDLLARQVLKAHRVQPERLAPKEFKEPLALLEFRESKARLVQPEYRVFRGLLVLRGPKAFKVRQAQPEPKVLLVSLEQPAQQEPEERSVITVSLSVLPINRMEVRLRQMRLVMTQPP